MRAEVSVSSRGQERSQLSIMLTGSGLAEEYIERFGGLSNEHLQSIDRSHA